MLRSIRGNIARDIWTGLWAIGYHFLFFERLWAVTPFFFVNYLGCLNKGDDETAPVVLRAAWSAYISQYRE